MNAIRITLSGEVPAKKNSRINTKSGRSFPSRRYAEWHERAALEALGQARGRTVDGACEISLTFVHGDLRRRDGDNAVSSVFDLLVDCGIIRDDNWRCVRAFSVRNFYQKSRPRCEISIREIGEEAEQ